MSRENIHVLSRAVIIDHDHLLLCQTLDLPKNFYFLPGGHVELGESVAQALLRELLEETGANCRIKRFLGCLEYCFEPGHSSICHNHEYNFVFEAESELLRLVHEMPQLEQNVALVWLPLTAIKHIDFRAEPLSYLISEWLKNEPSKQWFYSVMQ